MLPLNLVMLGRGFQPQKIKRKVTYGCRVPLGGEFRWVGRSWECGPAVRNPSLPCLHWPEPSALLWTSAYGFHLTRSLGGEEGAAALFRNGDAFHQGLHFSRRAIPSRLKQGMPKSRQTSGM